MLTYLKLLSLFCKLKKKNILVIFSELTWIQLSKANGLQEVILSTNSLSFPVYCLFLRLGSLPLFLVLGLPSPSYQDLEPGNFKCLKVFPETSWFYLLSRFQMNCRLLQQLTSPRWVPSDSASWRASNQLTPGGPTSQTAQVEAPATTPQCQPEVVMGKIMSFTIMFYYQQKVWDVRSQSWDKRLSNWAAH